MAIAPENIERIRTWLFDIRLWIVVLFLIRLENINLPPLDAHNWRQTITLGVSRNYLEWDANFFHPRTVICDSRGGIQAQEFPVLNYAIFLLWKIFGQQNWCFRLLVLTVASIGLWHFFQIARRFLGEHGALAATVTFAVSMAFIYARKAMPDVFSVSLVLIGVNYGWRYLENGGRKSLALFFVFAALGMLSKIPATAALTLLAAPILQKTVLLDRKKNLLLVGTAAVACMAAWYFVWVPWAEETYRHYLFYPVDLARGWNEIIVQYWTNTWERFYPIGMKSFFAFAFFVLGFVLAVWRREKWLLLTFLAYSSVFFYFMLKAGMIFSTHEYYVIPYLPMMGLLAGYGLVNILKSEYLPLALIFIAIEAIWPQKEDFFIPWENRKYLRLEKITDSVVPKDARVLVNAGDGQPWMMYFAHRLGWTDEDRVRDTNWLDGEATVGLHYAIFDRSKTPDSIPYPMLYQDDDFRIFKIKKDAPPEPTPSNH